MSIFALCDRAVGLIRGNRLDLSLEAQVNALNYSGLISQRAQEEAITCVRHFPGVRDALLQGWPWVFAIRSAAPARLAVPLANWAYSYALPADCLRLLSVSSDGLELPLWSQEGQIVSCDREPVDVRYLSSSSRVLNVAQWPPLFADAVVLRLAVDISAAVTGNVGPASMLLQQFQITIAEAYRAGLINSLSSLPVDGYAWDGYSTGGWRGGISE